MKRPAGAGLEPKKKEKKNMMKRTLLCITAVIMAGFMSVSCFQEKGDDEPQEVTATVGVYVLSEGQGQEDDVLLTYYDTINDKASEQTDKFRENNNGMSLGRFPHDMLILDNHLVVAVTGSKDIKVIDKTSCQLLTSIKAEADGQTLSPKCLTVDGDVVYATFAEGYVGRINIEAGKVLALAKVGANPEGIAISNSMIYVANAGAAPEYGTTVTVLEKTDLVKKKDITVAANPQKLAAASDNKVFVISYGNGGDVPATLQLIDQSDNVKKVEEIEYPYDFSFRAGDKKLYVVDRFTDEAGNVRSSVKKIDAAYDAEYAGQVVESDLLGNLGVVAVDNLTGAIYACTSDPDRGARLSIFNERESLFVTVTVGGHNTRKVAFVQGQIWI